MTRNHASPIMTGMTIGRDLPRPSRRLRLAALGLGAAFGLGWAVAPEPARAAARPAGCDGMETAVEVTVRTSPGEVVTRTGHGQSDLEAIQRRHSNGAAKAAGRPMGLTLTEFQTDLKTRTRVMSLAPGLHCAALAGIEVAMSYPRFDVYIDRRYKAGSCEYAAIVEHEFQHVRFFRDSLERHKPEVRAIVQAAARKLQPVVLADPDQAASHFQDQILRLVQPSIARLSQATDRLNAAIDTPASYAAVERRCNDW